MDTIDSRKKKTPCVGEVFLGFQEQNVGVENQAGERVGVVNVARLSTQRLAVPAAQGVLAFSPFLIHRGCKIVLLPVIGVVNAKNGDIARK